MYTVRAASNRECRIISDQKLLTFFKGIVSEPGCDGSFIFCAKMAVNNGGSAGQGFNNWPDIFDSGVGHENKRGEAAGRGVCGA